MNYGDSSSGGYTVEYTSWGQRMGNSFCGMCFGAFLFVAAFPVLWWNEGNSIHTARALAEGAAKVKGVGCEPLDANMNQKLVSLM